jgi:hypothetical protein
VLSITPALDRLSPAAAASLPELTAVARSSW